MFRILVLVLLLGFSNFRKWPKHSIQQLYESNQTNPFDFIDKILRIKQPKFDIYVANPKPKPATKSKPNPPPKPEPKPAENFIISDTRVWQHNFLWLFEQIVNEHI